jgi:hypothetical protein
MLPSSVVLLQQTHCYAIWLLRYYGNAQTHCYATVQSRNYSNPLLHNRDYYVTMEMQYNLLLDSTNCYITMELPSRPNISQYYKI